MPTTGIQIQNCTVTSLSANVCATLKQVWQAFIKKRKT